MLLLETTASSPSTAAMPPETSSLLVKVHPPRDARALRGADAFAKASTLVDCLAALLHDRSALSTLLAGHAVPRRSRGRHDGRRAPIVFRTSTNVWQAARAACINLAIAGTWCRVRPVGLGKSTSSLRHVSNAAAGTSSSWRLGHRRGVNCGLRRGGHGVPVVQLFPHMTTLRIMLRDEGGRLSRATPRRRRVRSSSGVGLREKRNYPGHLGGSSSAGHRARAGHAAKMLFDRASPPGPGDDQRGLES